MYPTWIAVLPARCHRSRRRSTQTARECSRASVRWRAAEAFFEPSLPDRELDLEAMRSGHRRDLSPAGPDVQRCRLRAMSRIVPTPRPMTRLHSAKHGRSVSATAGRWTSTPRQRRFAPNPSVPRAEAAGQHPGISLGKAASGSPGKDRSRRRAFDLPPCPDTVPLCRRRIGRKPGRATPRHGELGYHLTWAGDTMSTCRAERNCCQTGDCSVHASPIQNRYPSSCGPASGSGGADDFWCRDTWCGTVPAAERPSEIISDFYRLCEAGAI